MNLENFIPGSYDSVHRYVAKNYRQGFNPPTLHWPDLYDQFRQNMSSFYKRGYSSIIPKNGYWIIIVHCIQNFFKFTDDVLKSKLSLVPKYSG